ncbi:MAG TPA: LCP family protein [Patescibacteria group bacterium]|nr:LCP family protein [Patescibacteria group bacterium]
MPHDISIKKSSRSKKKNTNKNLLVVLLVGALLMGGFFYLYFLISPYYRFFHEVFGVSPLTLLLEKKPENSQITILLLGKGGEFHEGAELTDSLMSVTLGNKGIYVVSLARDIWIADLQDRVNTAYYYGKQKGEGFSLVKRSVGVVTGRAIDAVFIIDFERFSKLIDYIGGINVYIDRSFEDFKYPIKGRENDVCDGKDEFACRYEYITFQKGWEHMDGVRALKFARSRFSPDKIEGTDFARARRQQKIFMSLYEKILQKLKNPNLEELRGMYVLLNAIVERDMSNRDIAYLAKEVYFTKPKIEMISLNQDFFTVPPYKEYGGKYVLIPRDGNFDDIHAYIRCRVSGKTDASCLPEKIKDISKPQL